MSNLTAGKTPLIFSLILANKLHLARSQLFIKREDENPTGSHKDRSVWPMSQSYLDEGKRDFVISSSGNAAISAAWYVRVQEKERNKDATLRVFVSPRMDPLKQVRLERAIGESDRICIEESDRPKHSAFQYAKKTGAVFLRASQDDRALMGYESLASELLEQVPDVGSVFIPTSSGTLALGLFEAYRNLSRRQLPELHIIQTARIHPIASVFDQDFVPQESSKASAIVDNVAHRKVRVVRMVKETGGFGWVIQDQELEAAKDLFAQCVREEPALVGIEPGFDSLLSLAGLMKALRKGWVCEKSAVMLFTGR